MDDTEWNAMQFFELYFYFHCIHKHVQLSMNVLCVFASAFAFALHGLVIVVVSILVVSMVLMVSWHLYNQLNERVRLSLLTIWLSRMKCISDCQPITSRRIQLVEHTIWIIIMWVNMNMNIRALATTLWQNEAFLLFSNNQFWLFILARTLLLYLLNSSSVTNTLGAAAAATTIRRWFSYILNGMNMNMNQIQKLAAIPLLLFEIHLFSAIYPRQQ